MNTTAQMWAVAPREIPYVEDDAYIYRVFLDQPNNQVRRLRELLSQDEQARAERFHFERDRRRYVVGRAGLRQLLARHLKVDPQSIVFTYGRYGKPELAIPPQGLPIKFNLTHSDTLALYAFTQSHAIGVDVERVRPLVNADQIAERYFAHDEWEALRRFPMQNRSAAFFTCWTRKEAYVKALGLGVSAALDSFVVSITEPARLLHIAGNVEEAARWSLYSLTPAPGYVATVVVEGPPQRLRCWSWPL